MLLACITGLLLHGVAMAVDTCPPTTRLDTQLPTFDLDGGLAQMEWVGASGQVIFAISAQGLLYRSGDYGNSWVHTTAKIRTNETALGKLKGMDLPASDLFDRGGISSIVFEHGRPDEVFFVGHGGRHWATLDKGDSYVQPCGLETHGDICLQHPAPGQTLSPPFVKLHPTMKSHMLALVRRDSCFTSGASSDCAEDLYVTSTFGQTWTNLTANANGRIVSFVDFDWARGKDHEMHILATVYSKREHLAQRNFDAWDKHVDFVRSKDLFKTVDEEGVLPCANAFSVSDGKVFAAVAVDCGKETAVADRGTVSGGVELHISMDDGLTFHDVCFPVALQNNGFSILDIALGETAHICVDHDEEDGLEASAPVGNIYTSDTLMEMFGLSQRRAFRPHNLAVDFMRVAGMPGTLMTNQVSSMALDDPAVRGGKASFENYLQTRISYAEGASWHSLTAPSVDSEGKEMKCTVCDLHLHGPSSWFKWGQSGWYPSFYAHTSAPGVLLGVGNVGEFLQSDPGHLNTYLSRDGGQTWSEIRKRPHIYEFSDHGGLILLAEHATSGATDELWFSRDEGLCFEGPVVLPQPMYIENIRVEPKSRSHVFVAHGLTTNDRGLSVATLVTVDLRRLLGNAVYPLCSQAKDYEYWSPTLEHCLLGRNFSMERRKREARCFNGYDYEHKVVGERAHCACNFDHDVQCEFGYARAEVGDMARCVIMSGESGDRTCPGTLGDRDWRDTGDRLVNNDVCTHPERVLAPEPSRHTSHRRSGLAHGLRRFAWGVALALVIIGGTGAAGYVAFTKLGLAQYLPEGAASTAAEWAGAAAERAEQGWHDFLAWLDGKFNSDGLNYSLLRQPLDNGGLHLDDDEDSREATSLHTL